MKSPLLFIALGSVLLSGCSGLPSASLTDGRATLHLQAAVRDGAYRVMALPSAELLPYTAASVDYLEVRLFTLDGATEAPVLDTRSQPLARTTLGGGTTVTFERLRAHTTYRARAYAYRHGEIISLEGAYADIVVSNDDRPAFGTLTVTLKNRLFRGDATSSAFVVEPGGAATASETVELGPELPH